MSPRFYKPETTGAPVGVDTSVPPGSLMQSPKEFRVPAEGSAPVRPDIDCNDPRLAGTELCRRAREGTLNLSPECAAILRAALASGQSIDDLRSNELCASFASLLIPASGMDVKASGDPLVERHASNCYAQFLALSTFDQARVLEDGATGGHRVCLLAAADLRNGHTASAKAGADWLFRTFPRDSREIRDFCSAVGAAYASHAAAAAGAVYPASSAKAIQQYASKNARPGRAIALGASTVGDTHVASCVRYLSALAMRDAHAVYAAFMQSPLSASPQYSGIFVGGFSASGVAELLNRLRRGGATVGADLDVMCQIARGISPAGDVDMDFSAGGTSSVPTDAPSPWAGLSGGGLGAAYNPTTGQRFDPATGQAVAASPDLAQTATGILGGITGLAGGYLRGEQATQIAASQAQATTTAAQAAAQAQRDVAQINAQRDIQIAMLRQQQQATTDPTASAALQAQIANLQAQFSAALQAQQQQPQPQPQSGSGMSTPAMVGGIVLVLGLLLGGVYVVSRPSRAPHKSNSARNSGRSLVRAY